MKYNGKHNHSFGEQMKIGAGIARLLHPIASRESVGESLGISGEAVRKIECRALYKLAMRILNNNQQT